MSQSGIGLSFRTATVNIVHMLPPAQKFDDAAKRRALAIIEAGGTLTDAARAAGVRRQAIHYHRARDPAFAQAVEDARQRLLERLEAEAVRRATEGYWEVTQHPDGTTTRKLKVSDTLLLALLKKHDPQGFGVDRVQVDASVTGRIEQAAISHRLGRMPIGDKRELLALLDAATAPDGTFDADRLGHADRARFAELAQAVGFDEPTLELGP
jgi:hypothetical protein